MDRPEIAERYGLLLDSFLRGCGSFVYEFPRQVQGINRLLLAAEEVCTYMTANHSLLLIVT